MSELPIGSDYQSITDVLNGLGRLEAEFFARNDRRGVFVSAYLQITSELQRRIELGQFHDVAWVGNYVVEFARLYQYALRQYETGVIGTVPGPWALSLKTSSEGQGLVIQDLLLGINAHINHDLPFALEKVGIGPNRSGRYDDHNAVNVALRRATDAVQDRIAKMYSLGLGVLDRLLGPLDEKLTSFSFEVAREHAWEMGVAIANAQSSEDRANQTRSIDRQASVLGRLILVPNLGSPWLIHALREIEKIKPWRNVLKPT